MRLAHLADLHLGFRQYERANPKGANQREADVALALSRAVDGVLEARPDAVLVAGDVFHQIQPRNASIMRLFAELQRIRAGLPAAEIVLIAGDHDTPRSSEASSILGLYRALGARVVERDIEPVELRGGLRVLAVPKARARALKDYAPAPGDVLLLHGEVRNVPGAQLERACLEHAAWAYVALGHWHVCEQIASRAWYAGSLDYVSTDPWDELRTQQVRNIPGKGWLLVDLGDGEPRVEFRPIEPPRRFVDLPLIDGELMGAPELDAAIAAAAIGIEGAVVRQVVLNVSRETHRALDHRAIAGLKASALHYGLDVRRPAWQAPTPEGRAERRKRLDEIVDEFLVGRELPADVDREALRRLGQHYLAAGAGGAELESAQGDGGSGQG